VIEDDSVSQLGVVRKASMEYQLSKSITDGTLVTLRGNKFIRANSKSKVVGVWSEGLCRKVLPLDGRMGSYSIPEGVVFQGQVSVASIVFSDD